MEPAAISAMPAITIIELEANSAAKACSQCKWNREAVTHANYNICKKVAAV